MPSPARVFFLLPGPYVYEDRCQAFVGRSSLFGYREPVEETAAAGLLIMQGARCGLCYAAAEGLSDRKVLARILAFAPDLLLISTSFPGHGEDLAWAGRIKQALPGCRVAARGGQMPFVDRQRLFSRFPALDAIVPADYGENLAGWLKQGLSQSAPGVILRDRPETDRVPARFAAPLSDLSAGRRILRHSAYPSPDTGRPMASILCGTGCSHRCSFCLAPLVSGNAPRFREPEDIAEEMLRAKGEHGIRRFFLRADDLCADRGFVLDLCEAIARRAPGLRFVATARADGIDAEIASALSRAGCWGLSMGLESGSADTLARVKKGLGRDAAERALKSCRENRIMSMGYFMLGFPWETGEDVRKTLEEAKRLAPDVCEYFFPYPFPGTGLFGEALRLGLVDEDAPLPQSQVRPLFAPRDMSREELLRLRGRARRSPRAIIRAAAAVLRQARSPREALDMAASRLWALGRALG